MIKTKFKRLNSTFKILILNGLLFLFGNNPLSAQSADTTFLTAFDFLKIVEENHPVAQQARLILDNADAERLQAGGNFDPKLFNQTTQKYFDDKTYYRLQNSGLEIPAWFGLSAKAGYETNDGIFLNDQNTLPESGLWYADVSWTVGRGLFIDRRRAMLRQARLLQESAEFEVQWALNQLLTDAMQDYWEWYRAYFVNQVYDEAVDLARLRFEQVRINAFVGEEPFIDTLEAYIQYQNRVLSRQKSAVDLVNARQSVETYLWLDGQVPLELQETTIPFFDEDSVFNRFNFNALENHPLLQFYNLKIDGLEIEQRLNREQLKPQLDLRYKFLNEPVAREGFFEEYSPNNYEWGLRASFPIFLRKERGKIRQTGVKIQDTDFERTQKRRELETKIEALQNELQLTRQQLAETRRVAENYQRLLRAEITKFENGESSLFLINQREIKYLESREKVGELEAKVRQVAAKLRGLAAEF